MPWSSFFELLGYDVPSSCTTWVSCLTPAQLASLKALEHVTVTDSIMCGAIDQLKAAMEPGELKSFLKALELKDTATTFVTFRKIFMTAFGFHVERQNPGKLTKAWHFVDVKPDWLALMKQKYAPACLDPEARRGSGGQCSYEPPPMVQTAFASHRVTFAPT